MSKALKRAVAVILSWTLICASCDLLPGIPGDGALEALAAVSDEEYDSVFENFDDLSIEDAKRFYYNQLDDFEKKLYEKMMEFDMEEGTLLWPDASQRFVYPDGYYEILSISKNDIPGYTSTDIENKSNRAWTALINDDPTRQIGLERAIVFPVETEDSWILRIARTQVSEYARRKTLARLEQIKNTFYNPGEDRYITIYKLWDFMDRYTEYEPYLSYINKTWESDPNYYKDCFRGEEKRSDYNDCMAGSLYNGISVCGGYSMTTKAICNALDIPCVCIGGVGHDWNLVEMEDGKWYSVDLTMAQGSGHNGISPGATPHWELLGRRSEAYTGDWRYMGGVPYLWSINDYKVDFKFPTLSDESYKYEKSGADFKYTLAPLNFDEAEGRFVYKVNDDNVSCTITDYVGAQTGDLIIPDEIDGYTVTDIGSEAFTQCRGFSGRLVLPDTLKNIEHSAFMNCSSLRGELILPKGLRSIGHYAFMGCNSLTSVFIPESVESLEGDVFFKPDDAGRGAGGIVIYEGSEAAWQKLTGGSNEAVGEKTVVLFDNVRITGVSLNSIPQNGYFVDGRFVTEGISVSAVFSDGTTRDIDSYNVLVSDGDAPDRKRVTVSFGGYEESFEVKIGVRPMTQEDFFASSNDNFAPQSHHNTISRLELQFYYVDESGISPDSLTMTVIKGSKLWVWQDVKSVTGTGIRGKVRNNTARFTVKESGPVEFEMTDGRKYTVTFNVQTPKVQKAVKTMSAGDTPRTLTIEDMFGTTLDGGELSIYREKVGGQACVNYDKTITVFPAKKDAITVTYRYLNKKYKTKITVR